MPSDTVDLVQATRAIYIGTGGEAKLTLVSDPASHTGVVFKNLAAGRHELSVRRVWATGTSVTDLIALG